MNKFSEIESKVRELSKQYSPHAEAYSYGGTSGWYILILEAIERLNANVEGVHKRLDEINARLNDISFSAHGQIEKSELMREVEERFGKSIEELLEEHEGKSVREIADELGISKSTVANWRKEINYD